MKFYKCSDREVEFFEERIVELHNVDLRIMPFRKRLLVGLWLAEPFDTTLEERMRYKYKAIFESENAPSMTYFNGDFMINTTKDFLNEASNNDYPLCYADMIYYENKRIKYDMKIFNQSEYSDYFSGADNAKIASLLEIIRERTVQRRVTFNCFN